jgi:hypothetical protein
MKTIESRKRFIRGYRNFFLAGAIFFNAGNIERVSAEDRDATAWSKNDTSQINSLASFDAEQFSLSGCNSTLLRDMKKKNVVPKSIKYNNEAAYKYENADATVFVSKNLNPQVSRDDSWFSLFDTVVTNLRAYNFTKPFHGKTLSDVEGFFKAKYEGSQRAGYKVDPSRKYITLNTEGADIVFYANKGGIYRIDFQCSNHD